MLRFVLKEHNDARFTLGQLARVLIASAACFRSLADVDQTEPPVGFVASVIPDSIPRTCLTLMTPLGTLGKPDWQGKPVSPDPRRNFQDALLKYCCERLCCRLPQSRWHTRAGKNNDNGIQRDESIWGKSKTERRDSYAHLLFFVEAWAGRLTHTNTRAALTP